MTVAAIYMKKVAAQYNAAKPQAETESCNNKFKGLKNCSKPTGEANCPWEVTEAKAIQRDMESTMATMDSDGVGIKLQELCCMSPPA